MEVAQLAAVLSLDGARLPLGGHARADPLGGCRSLGVVPLALVDVAQVVVRLSLVLAGAALDRSGAEGALLLGSLGLAGSLGGLGHLLSLEVAREDLRCVEAVVVAHLLQEAAELLGDHGGECHLECHGCCGLLIYPQPVGCLGCVRHFLCAEGVLKNTQGG